MVISNSVIDIFQELRSEHTSPGNTVWITKVWMSWEVRLDFEAGRRPKMITVCAEWGTTSLFTVYIYIFRYKNWESVIRRQKVSSISSIDGIFDPAEGFPISTFWACSQLPPYSCGCWVGRFSPWWVKTGRTSLRQWSFGGVSVAYGAAVRTVWLGQALLRGSWHPSHAKIPERHPLFGLSLIHFRQWQEPNLTLKWTQHPDYPPCDFPPSNLQATKILRIIV